jgi:diguanylate cyclase (GGDEF)-like protein/PAS domain S-box-containing protein
LTFDIEQRTKEFRKIAKEINAIVIELQVSRQDDDVEGDVAVRLQTLLRSLWDLSIEVASDISIDIAQNNEMRDALEVSERQFRSLAENLPDNVARWDCSGAYLYVNRTLERTLRVEASEVVGTQISELHKQVRVAINHIVETGEELSSVRQQAFDENGEVQVHEISLIPERDEQGKIVSVLGIGRDMTRQVRIEEALAESERQFRTLAENLPHHLARHSSDASFMYLNPKLEAFLGCTSEQVLGRKPTDLFSERSTEKYEYLILETARTGNPNVTELVFTTADGRRVTHEIYFVPEGITTNSVASVLAIGYDITERKRVEQALKKALDFAEGIIAAVPDVLFEMDRDGTYLNVWTRNPDMLTSPKEVLLGKTVWDVLSAQKAAATMLAIREADMKGVTYGHVIPTSLPDGSRRWFEHSVAKKSGESPSADTFLVLSRDVTSRKQTEQALDAAHAQLLSVLQTIPDMVWLKNVDGTYLSCNHAFERMIGQRQSDVVGKTAFSVFDAELATLFHDRDMAAIEAKRICINEEWVTYPDTCERALLEARRVPVLDSEGCIAGVLGVARDITERKRFENMLAGREREFRTLVEHSPDTVARYGRDFRRVYANPTLAAQVEGGVSSLVGKRPSECPGGENAILYEHRLGEVFASGMVREFELNWVGKDGLKQCSLIKLTPEPDADGAVETVLAIGRDITELNASREKIHQMAFFDELTTLPNRVFFGQKLRQLLNDASARQILTGVMMIDMDRFKGVNDTMGHAVGDELLREAARRLRACVRSCDTVARFGGDEFAILAPSVPNRCALEDIARAIIDRFDECFVLDGKEVFISCSIGIALYPVDGVAPDDLMKYADSAMYLAKHAGGRCFRLYAKKLTVDAAAHLLLESELRRAIERGEFELHYQPKVSLHSSEVIGSEALIRWKRPGVGFFPPDQFIPVAEKTGLITDLGRWVLREACRTAAEWNSDGNALHKVAVNLSARQFQFHDLSAIVKEILIETDCSPDWIELEITESLLLEEDEAILSTLVALKSMGITIAIDDFGTGYSALSYLAKFPIDVLKIDKSFIQKVTADQRHAELVKAMLSIANCLGQQVIAEGVETVQQAVFLAENGCRIAQGYLYSRPLSKLEMTALPRYLNSDVTSG